MTAMFQPGRRVPANASPCPELDQWRHDRLTEARGILADAAHYPDTLVILAARVIAGQSDDADERAEAIDLGRLLCRRPVHLTSRVRPARRARS